MAELVMLSPAQLQLAAYNPRKTFDQESLNELAESLKAQGMLQPILVRQLSPAQGKKAAAYEVVCGARRTKAAELAGLTELPCNVAELTDDQAIEAAITENLQRQDVAPMEEARAFAALLDRGYTLQQLGERFGKSHVHIWNRVQLAKATPELQAAIEAGTIPLTYARELAKFPAEVQQQECENLPLSYYRDPQAYRNRLIERYGMSLNQAPFDLAMAGCASCEFNSVNRSLGKEAYCLAKSKYNELVRAHVLKILSEIPSFFKLVARSYHLDVANKMWQGHLPEGRHIVPVGWLEAYEIVSEPQMPKFEAPDRDDYEDEANYAEALQEANEEHADDMQHYEAAMEDYKQEIKSCKRAFCMYGDEIGTIVYLKETGRRDASVKEEEVDDDLQAQRRELSLEIAGIASQIERLPELASEKAYEVAREQINDLAMYKGIDSIDDQPPLLDEEVDALYLHMLSARVSFLPDNVRRAIMGKTYGSSFTPKQIEAALAVKKQLWPMVVRQYLKQQFQHINGSSCSSQERYAWDKIALALEDVDYNEVAKVRDGYAAKLEKAINRKKELEAALELLGKEVTNA
jgi:ParB/RepB/Spo0J family partition protein